jgi:inorganic pyrophosphatase
VQGDNDPVDVVEIGGTCLETAGVYCVKPLGAYAMIDGGELDWKVLCICTDDPLAAKLNDIIDVERYSAKLELIP